MVGALEELFRTMVTHSFAMRTQINVSPTKEKPLCRQGNGPSQVSFWFPFFISKVPSHPHHPSSHSKQFKQYFLIFCNVKILQHPPDKDAQHTNQPYWLFSFLGIEWVPVGVEQQNCCKTIVLRSNIEETPSPLIRLQEGTHLSKYPYTGKSTQPMKRTLFCLLSRGSTIDTQLNSKYTVVCMYLRLPYRNDAKIANKPSFHYRPKCPEVADFCYFGFIPIR